MLERSRNMDIAFWLGMALVTVLAAWMRVRDVAMVSVLQDTVGPFWASLRLDGRTHVPGYGVAMLLPYWLVLSFSENLWMALSGFAWIHGLVAPVGMWIARRRMASSLSGSLLVGIVLAFDPGLMSSVQSGAEGYLAPLFCGLAVAARGSLAWICLAMATAHHPLALCALPLLFIRENFKRNATVGAIIFVVLVGQQALASETAGVPSVSIQTAFMGLIDAGNAAGVAALVGPLFAFWIARVRGASVRLLCALLSMVIVGLSIGYLRDHHLRILAVPAVAFLATSPRIGAVVLVAAVAAIPARVDPPEVAMRAGTLGLTSAIADRAFVERGGLVVDRAWISGGPGVEPSAVLLDLHLRGLGPDRLHTEGDVVLIVASNGAGRGSFVVPGSVWIRGHGYAISFARQGVVRTWSKSLCGTNAKTGGAWDGLSILHPEIDSDEVGTWWACP